MKVNARRLNSDAYNYTAAVIALSMAIVSGVVVDAVPIAGQTTVQADHRIFIRAKCPVVPAIRDACEPRAPGILPWLMRATCTAPFSSVSIRVWLAVTLALIVLPRVHLV